MICQGAPKHCVRLRATSYSALHRLQMIISANSSYRLTLKRREAYMLQHCEGPSCSTSRQHSRISSTSPLAVPSPPRLHGLSPSCIGWTTAWLYRRTVSDAASIVAPEIAVLTAIPLPLGKQGEFVPKDLCQVVRDRRRGVGNWQL